MNEHRERDKLFENALLCSPEFNTGDPAADRQAAIDWGKIAFLQNPGVPFTPSGHGAIDAGIWPAEFGDLIDLQERGRLPDAADLDYGVTISRADWYGIRRLGNDAFIAIVGGNVHYAEKLSGVRPDDVVDG